MLTLDNKLNFNCNGIEISTSITEIVSRLHKSIAISSNRRGHGNNNNNNININNNDDNNNNKCTFLRIVIVPESIVYLCLDTPISLCKFASQFFPWIVYLKFMNTHPANESTTCSDKSVCIQRVVGSNRERAQYPQRIIPSQVFSTVFSPPHFIIPIRSHIGIE